MVLVYGGIGVAAHSPWTLILTLPLALTIRYGHRLVRRQERDDRRQGGEAPLRAI
jgi:hypothetical protein